jgi:hypothetical protein
MRHFFSDEKLLLKKAESNITRNLTHVKKWWSEKYNLPANHELFEKQSLSELVIEMFEDRLLRKEKLMYDLENEDLDLDARSIIKKQIKGIDKSLGYEEFDDEDELIDQWERELAEGKVPDFNR